ncbi:hypothetical protein [Gracilibacillus sp. JCM 18860]|uniref:hypothetical protein n=1 Tax=Gracilibacillus sp. JCM 18860 TaxID=1306159 RepID=UPI000B011234
MREIDDQIAFLKDCHIISEISEEDYRKLVMEIQNHYEPIEQHVKQKIYNVLNINDDE